MKVKLKKEQNQTQAPQDEVDYLTSACNLFFWKLIVDEDEDAYGLGAPDIGEGR